MKKLLFVATLLFAVAACSESDNDDVNLPDPPGDTQTDDPNLSVKGEIEYIDIYHLNEGPHDLLIVGNNMFAKRDNKIWLFSIANPENPQLNKEFSLPSTAHTFGKLYEHNGSVYAPNYGNGLIYQFDQQLNLVNELTIDGINNFAPNVIHIDANQKYWIGGSNGSGGTLAECSLSGNQLTVNKYWSTGTSNSLIESMVEKNNYLIASIAGGDALSFIKTDISSGPVSTVSFENEPGHEKWGKTLVVKDNKAFWANWGAGFATINISQPQNLTIDEILSNSKFKGQFPGSEGTNVYDIAYNSTKNLLCVANGWSGLFLVAPENPGKVIDYIDLQYIQNYSVATNGNYIYTGNISGGINGDLKGIVIYKLK